MRILSITAQKPHSTGSGVYLTELVKGFAKLGHEQAVIAGIYKEDMAEFPEGVEFYPVYFHSEALPFAVTGMSDEMPYESTRYRDVDEDMGKRFRQAFERCVKRAVEEFCPEIIICHHLYILTALVRQWCPQILVAGICHGSDIRQFKKNEWQRQRILAGIKNLDRVFALHDVQRQEIIELYGIDEDKVHTIGTGYNDEIFFRQRETDAERERRRGKLLFAGKLSEKKGVMSLLRALRYVSHPENMELTLAGSTGNEVELREIESLAKMCPVRTVLAGRIPQNELAHLMRGHEVFVLPSFYEGLPLVVIEALACGEKVVCTDLPGIRPWLDKYVSGHGVVFVEQPEMAGEDEPLEEALPLFEKRLAQAVETALERPFLIPKGLTDISWEGICREILKVCLDTLSIF